MPDLSDADLLMVADVVGELAKLRDASFDKAGTGFAFAAALVDPAFKARLGAMHRRLKAQGSMRSSQPVPLIASLFGDLEAAAEAVVSGLWELEERAESCSEDAHAGALRNVRLRASATDR